MKIWICSTLTSFFGPTQGAARLNAFLKKQGHSVSLKDFNQDSYFGLLSASNLGRTLYELKYNIDTLARSSYLRENIGSILSNSSRGAIDLLLEDMVGAKPVPRDIIYTLLEGAEYVVQKVESARQKLDKHFLTLPADEFLSSYRSLLCGKAIIDAAYFPAQLDMGLGFHGTAFSSSAREILRATSDLRFNFLISYFQNEVRSALVGEQPAVVGISVTHSSEFVPALTLARLVKDTLPEAHICLGGAAVTEIAHRIVKNRPLWDLFDSIVLGPGEVSFSELVEHLDTRRDLATVPNLFYKANGRIKKSDEESLFDINEACTPDFGPVRPGTPLPLETASGCYWGKCIFCYYPRQGTASMDTTMDRRRVRTIDRVLEDIAVLRDKYHPGFIGITDSSLHPSRIEQIAAFNQAGEEKVSFSAFVRFEDAFRSVPFCHKIAEGGFLGGQIGLECGSQRVNDIINKGVDVVNAEEVLRNFRRTGILAHLYTLVGTPGETAEDAATTCSFIEKTRDFLPLGWQVYPLYVLEHGPLNERAKEFGLSTSALPDEYLSQFMVYGVSNGLSQTESTGLSIDFARRLQPYLHPVCDLMDIESQKVFLLAQRARGVFPAQV